MWIINHKRIFFGISLLLVLGSFFVIFTDGLNLGIDFTGGSLIEVEYEDEFDIEVIRGNLESLSIGEFNLQPTGERGLILRTSPITEETRTSISGEFAKIGKFEEKRLTNIGPTIGSELKNKAYVAIVIVIALIILFIAWAFRKGGKQVSSWTFGIIAVVALIHDIIIPTGLFSWLGHTFGGFEVNALFITALLAILGYSVNDTIVVFDRVRENFSLKQKGTFSETIGASLDQTIARSINTSLTTLLVLFTLYFLGGESTKEFSLVLIFGIISGTYSSIFLAAPLLTIFYKKK